MFQLNRAQVHTKNGTKYIEAYCGDVLEFGEKIDILTTSAFQGSYEPTPWTIFGALHKAGIQVVDLAQKPAFDLREPCHTWLSEPIHAGGTNIRRIGCVEMISLGTWDGEESAVEQSMIDSIRAYFAMLDIAAIYGTEMETIVLPLLGGGDQNICPELMIVPLLNECICFLRRNDSVQRICFVEINIKKASLIANYLQESYALMEQAPQLRETSAPKAKVFLSYASGDKNIADNLCAKLESRGVRVWYAPRDVQGPYAAAIVDGIDSATHFVVILSQNSIRSQHVLNEIDLAFQALPNNIKFKPLRIDESMFTASFKYYLSRQHWMDAHIPPLEDRLTEFVDKLLEDL